MLFHDQKLEYFKGNYDTYVKRLLKMLKKKEYEVYVEKRARIMDFLDKFRYNDNSANLVQIRMYVYFPVRHLISWAILHPFLHYMNMHFDY